MVDIRIRDLVAKCISTEDGEAVYKYIHPLLKQGEHLRISFRGVDNIPSSFVNAAFIDLLGDFDFAYIKNHIEFQDTTRQINSIIKKRFDFELSRSIRDVTSPQGVSPSA